MGIDGARFRQLTETRGVPGREGQVRQFMREALAATTDGVMTDVLGNGSGTKRGRHAVRMLVAAQMDEIGFLTVAGGATTFVTGGSRACYVRAL